MYQLTYKIKDVPHTFEAETLDEILAMALHIFDEGDEFDSIYKGEKKIYSTCEIYKLIKRCYY